MFPAGILRLIHFLAKKVIPKTQSKYQNMNAFTLNSKCVKCWNPTLLKLRLCFVAIIWDQRRHNN